MRSLVLSVLGATALASGSIASAAVTVNAGTVVNLNDPTPSTSVATAGGDTTINFGFNPIVNAEGTNSFSSSFTISDPLAGIYSISGDTSTPGVIFSNTSNLTCIASVMGCTVGTVYNLIIGTTPSGFSAFGLPLTNLAAGDYRLTINGISPNSGSFTGNVRITTGAVPEPGTWALMLLGFGAVGLTMRRKRKQDGRLLQIA
jgi:hypothetical protein